MVKEFYLFLLWILTFLLNVVSANPLTYFQQHVKYKIDVRLDIERHQLAVDEILVYTNQSPDTLDTLNFYLYLNKFRQGSLYNPNLKRDLGAIRIKKIIVDDSVTSSYFIDQTLMTLDLNRSLLPGDSIIFKFDFIALIPPADERYGYLGNHYDIGNWYITPVVYDRYGWHLNQHLDNEFYQEWGDYQVNITLPKGFVVGATGVLIDSSTTYNLSADQSDQISIDSSFITWQFEAKWVHDFAWTTDPSYVLMQAHWHGITLNVLALDYNAESWKAVSQWGMQAIQFFCDSYGMYPYKQLTVADTYIKAGGIEYPQIVMINDYSNPDYEASEFRALVIHEIAHNWFYGLLANNQTEKEWMDEGFTTFAEIKAVEAIFGRYENLNAGDRGWFINKFGYTNDDRLDNALSYLQVAKFDLDPDPIDLHADYLGNDGYMLQYSKMAMVLFMLEYTLGDSVFALGMRNYFDQWHFKHPYPEDFYAVMEKTAERDLTWFFEQWLNTNRKLDYCLENFWSELNSDTSYNAYIKFRRIGQIFMPIDFSITLKNGAVCKYHIPIDNTSKHEYDQQILPYWHFSRKDYLVNLNLPDDISHIEIDPSLRLMDINRLNNVPGILPPQDFYFMRMQSEAPPLDKYIWEAWPDIMWNQPDILKLGVNLKGSYLNIDHKLNTGIWYKVAQTNLDFDLNYRTPFKNFGRFTWFQARIFTLDGRQGAQVGLSHILSYLKEKNMVFDFGLSHHRLYDDRYLVMPWERGVYNTVYINWSRETTYQQGWKPKFLVHFNFKTSIFGSESDFSQVSIELMRKLWELYSEWELNLRFFAGYSEGSTPQQYLFNLSGDNGWGEFQEPLYRSKGTFPNPWRKNGNLYKNGGGNIRGYPLIEEPLNLLGSRILSLNIDVKMPTPLATGNIPVIRDVSPYLFADFGNVWNHAMPKLGEFKFSTGFSLEWAAYSIFDYLFNLKSVRFDFPIFLNKTSTQLRFRWQIRFDFE